MVLVSHTNEFIFLKTVKTAGTSVEMCLEPACTKSHRPVREKTRTRISAEGIIGARMSRQMHPKWLFRRVNRWRNHMPAAEVCEALGRDMFEGYTKVTAVRNPFTRCVSLFHYRNPEVARDGADFAATRRKFRNYILNARWPGDVNITHLDGRYIIDRAVRFEHLSEDINATAAALGVPQQGPHIPRTKVNAAARKGHSAAEYYDTDTIAKVRSKMAWVFDNFDYPDTPHAGAGSSGANTTVNPDQGERRP